MGLSVESLNALDAIRVTTQAVLNDQKLSARQVDERRVNTRPVRLLSFDFYGTGDEVNRLIDLNQDINVSYYDGDIKILTA